jgi:hypothetical protein
MLFRVFATTALLFALNVAALAQDEAQVIVDRAIKEHGGRANVAKLATAQMKARSKSDFPNIGTQTLTTVDSWRLPGQYKTEFEIQFKDRTHRQTTVVTGDQMWISINGETRTAPKDFQAEMREQIHAESLYKLFPFLRHAYDLSTGDTVTIDGQAAIGVRVCAEGHRDVELYFGERTGLLLKAKRVAIDPKGKEHVHETLFQNHREMEGVKYFTRFVTYIDGNKGGEGEVTELDFREKFGDNVFAKP